MDLMGLATQARVGRRAGARKMVGAAESCQTEIHDLGQPFRCDDHIGRFNVTMHDIAAVRGGNCELTKCDEVVRHNGVNILGPSNFASMAPYHASQMFSANVVTFLKHLSGFLPLEVCEIFFTQSVELNPFLR